MKPALVVLVAAAGICPADSWDRLTDELMSKFDTHHVVALGEWHGSEQDSELRIRLIRHPSFPAKVRYVVLEAANASQQAVIDRFIRGESVEATEIQKAWRDITTPGGADAPVYEAFLNEIRRLNRRLPPELRVRVLAADPPIDWSAIENREQWRLIAEQRESFAAELIEREVLHRSAKALVICGSGHLWQNNQVVKQPNLAFLLRRKHPGEIYSVMRLNPPEHTRTKLDAIIRTEERPLLLSLDSHPAGALSANDAIDLPIRLFADGAALRDIIDSAVYTYRSDAPGSVRTQDPGYESEKRRRRELLRVR